MENRSVKKASGCDANELLKAIAKSLAEETGQSKMSLAIYCLNFSVEILFGDVKLGWLRLDTANGLDKGSYITASSLTCYSDRALSKCLTKAAEECGANLRFISDAEIKALEDVPI